MPPTVGGISKVIPPTKPNREHQFYTFLLQYTTTYVRAENVYFHVKCEIVKTCGDVPTKAEAIGTAWQGGEGCGLTCT